MRSTNLLPGLLAGVIFALLVGVALPSSAGSGTITTHQETAAVYGFGSKIAALGLDSGKWTGWIQTHRIDDVTFDIDFADANDSVTTVTMRCETSRTGLTANDAGRNFCSRSTSAGVSTYTCPHVWTLTTGTAEAWQWTATNINAPYLNCLFDTTGVPAAADTITVFARGVSP